MKKYAMGGSMTTTAETTKKPVKKTPKKPAQSKKSNEQNWGGEMGTAPFTTKENTERRKNLNLPTSKAEEKAYYEKMRREEEVISKSKNGKTMKKAQAGTSLGMKSVKSGYDNNSGVTRADFVAIGKGKAKSGTKLKKQAATAIAMKKAGKAPKMKKAMMGAMAKPMMKAGGKMTKCKYGCK
jgi:hypothetical protein